MALGGELTSVIGCIDSPVAGHSMLQDYNVHGLKLSPLFPHLFSSLCLTTFLSYLFSFVLEK